MTVLTASVSIKPVIKTFKCRDTEALFDGARVARFAHFAAVAFRKLQMVHAATRIETLRVPPQNRLEKLSGNRRGQWSIRVNDQFRVCFVWRDGAAWDVEIVDYH